MHFAKIDILYRVLRVIVADQDYVDTLPGTWVPCDYEGKYPKNYPGVGWTYDPNKVAFIPPKPFDSWVLNENCLWDPPVPMPRDGNRYTWDEESLSWQKLEKQ